MPPDALPKTYLMPEPAFKIAAKAFGHVGAQLGHFSREVGFSDANFFVKNTHITQRINKLIFWLYLNALAYNHKQKNDDVNDVFQNIGSFITLTI